MICTSPGHSYELDVYDNEISCGGFRQYLFFMKRIGKRYPGNTGDPHSGTNCQEVLRVLIDRLKYLNNQIPCAETESCINMARQMIFMLEVRAKRVKGKVLYLPLSSINYIEEHQVCKVCGHIGHMVCDKIH